MKREPIPVAFFSNTLARGGAEEHMLTLLRGLDRDRFLLHLICTDTVADQLAPDLPADVILLRLNLCRPAQLTQAIRLERFLRRRRIGILHSHVFYSSLFASPVAWASRVPVVVETPHVNELWRKGWKSSFFVDRLVGRCVDYYIAVSEANARYLVEKKGLPARKIKVIHNGCDLSRFSAGAPAPGLRESLGFSSEDQLLLLVGRLEPQKGHAVMLQAMATLRSEFPRLRLACLGDGALRASLQAQAESMQLADIVRFAGARPNVLEWLRTAVVVVLPSWFEGLPLVAIEALGAGRPMVATAVDGTPEVVVHEQTGLTVSPGDALALAAAIARMLRDPEWAGRLGTAGQAWVRQHFDQSAQIRATEALYLQAWQERGRAMLSPSECHPEESSREVPGRP